MIYSFYSLRSITSCKNGSIDHNLNKIQIVIPREVREQFNPKPGQKVMLIPYKYTIRLFIVPLIEKALGIFQGIRTGNIREEVDEER